MKSQKGITLMSLIIYVVAFVMIAGIIGAVTTFFYKNYAFLDEKSAVAAEYSKLNMAFAEESKVKDNYVYDFRSNQVDNESSKAGDPVFRQDSTSFFSGAASQNLNYSSKYDLLDDLNYRCKQFFNTYIIFYDETFIGWKKNNNVNVIYYNQTKLCEDVNGFSINRNNINGHDVITVFVEFDSKSFSTKYTF